MTAPSTRSVAIWPTTTSWSAAHVRSGRRWACGALAAFTLVMWFLVPHGIGASWRECDTQAIARNFLLDGFDPLRPRVDWRGDTDGAVECEFPLYQLAIAAVMKVTGIVEWPGRLLALLSTVLAACALHRLLERRTGPDGALVGLATFLVTGSAALLATRVMPDALSLAFSNLALLVFVRYLETGALAPLAFAVAAAALSGLQKPLSLQVGLVMFGWTLGLAPTRLRDWRLWLGFAVVPAIVALWLVHGAHLHAETGLSFGVVSGGDTKFPDVAHLRSPAVWAEMLRTTAQYGVPVFAMFAAGWLAFRRRLDRGDWTLMLATAIGLVVSLRYSYTRAEGPHYHAFAAGTGAWLVARAWPARAGKWLWLTLLAVLAVHAAWHLRDERRMRNFVTTQPIVAAAQAIASALRPDDVLLVRSEEPRFDREWGRARNIEDPRFFFLTSRRGFVVAADEWTVATLTDRRRHGATIVFDPQPETTPAATAAWLADQAELLHDAPQARVWRLRPAQ